MLGGAFLLLTGCGEPAMLPPDTGSPTAPAFVALDAPRLLRRIRLDLNGRLPSTEDLDTVADDPGQLWPLVEGYLDDPLLGDRMVEVWGERWGMLRDDPLIGFVELDIEEDQRFAFGRSSYTEPLRLLAHVVVTDRPFAEVVTADYTVANGLLAHAWPLDTPTDEEDWVVSAYTDGRPMSGMLSTNGLWWRHVTDESNANRRRAAAISRMFLCEDFLSRPISFSALDVAAVDEEAAAAAVLQEPACAGCHSTLDPMAATLFGFWWFEEHNISETGYYHHEREALSAQILGVRPGWFGRPLSGLADLGEAVASDPRFPRCITEHTAAALWRREPAVDEHDKITALTEAFADDGLRLKALLRAVLQTDDYQAGDLTAEAPDAVAERAVLQRMLSPDQLSDALAEQTGYTWTYQGTDIMNADSFGGMRILAGGVDGLSVRAPQQDPGLTWALVTRRLAEAAADHAIQSALDGAPPDLLAGVALDEAPDEDTLAALHWRLIAEPAGAAWLDAAAALWATVEADAGATEAWKTTLVVLFSDPAFVTY